MDTEEYIISIDRINSIRVPLQKFFLKGRQTGIYQTKHYTQTIMYIFDQEHTVAPNKNKVCKIFDTCGLIS